jgi:hypothetical protein
VAGSKFQFPVDIVGMTVDHSQTHREQLLNILDRNLKHKALNMNTSNILIVPERKGVSYTVVGPVRSCQKYLLIGAS